MQAQQTLILEEKVTQTIIQAILAKGMPATVRAAEEILNIAPHGTKQEKRFQKLSRITHPDKLPLSLKIDGTAAQQIIVAARDIIVEHQKSTPSHPTTSGYSSQDDFPAPPRKRSQPERAFRECPDLLVRDGWSGRGFEWR